MSKVNVKPARTSSPPPEWMQRMRQAATNAVTPDDIDAIVKLQVKKAREGNEASIRFVFDVVLGGSLQGVTYIQQNFGVPILPTNAMPGTSEKIEAMTRRAEAGLPVQLNGDGEEINLD